MSQYHYLCNFDKKEFVHPHKLGDGLKAREQVASGPGGIGSAMIYLMVCPEPRGGGDFNPNDVMGRWHGDRVAIIGDYAEKGDTPWLEEGSPWDRDGWHDISAEVARCLADELDLRYSGEGLCNREEATESAPAGYFATYSRDAG